MEQENQSSIPHEEATHESSEENAYSVTVGKDRTGNTTDSLIVIGLGASAGGLAALRAFFSAVPHDTGMTFVVIVHLSPEHESVLAELLQGYTLMPVRQVQAQTKMEPNHVYVIPPAKRLVVNEGHLDLAEFDMPRGPRLQIDTFFRSLAEQHGDGAAIILSGTGSDGAVGIQSIKEEGGLILVQSPDEAEYDGMPKSAIATGLADIVAPVEELARQLVAAKRTRASLQLPTNADELSEPAQQTLIQLLVQLRMRTGHDFSGYKRSTILRRIARRMQLVQLDTLSAYLNRLRQDGEEADALYRDLLIHVTEFFRDASAWRYLQEEIIPKVFEGKGREDSVRVWTVGCATGEEAYGIGMLLLEYADTLDNPPHIQIFASDLGRLVLDFAREGAYPEAIAADVSEERLKRFFVHDNSHYRVRPEVRERVLFAPHNLLQDPPFSKLDMVLCRNLLIYLQRPMQERVFDAFFYALQPKGYLFLGSAESTDGVTEHFDTVNKQHRVYQRGQRHADTLILPSLSLTPRHLQAESRRDGPATPQSGEAEQHRLMLEEIGLPSLLVDVNNNVLHYSETAGRYLQHPAGRPTNDVMLLVRSELQTELRLAITRAFTQKEATRTRSVSVRFNGDAVPVTVLVRPTRQGGRLLLLFLEEEAVGGETRSVGEEGSPRAPSGARVDDLQAELYLTQQRLQATREEYETTVEELRAANEELQSTNEEYRSTLEELETSKEELQSINEELQSVNQEMRSRVDEVSQANSDLQNLFAATEIATLFLDRELRVKRYTPRAAALFNFMPPDRGRPIGHLRTNLIYATLEADAERVLETLVPMEREIRAEDGAWYLLSVRPYRTLEDKIDGVVITCVEITENKRAEEELRAAKEYAESIVTTIPDALLVLDTNLRIQQANDAFYEIFQTRRDETEGSLVYELGNGQWNIPDLRELLEKILPANSVFAGYEVDHYFEQIGRRTMLLNARRLDHLQLILLAIADITERKEAEEALRRSEERYRTLFESIDEGFCTIEMIFDAQENPVDYRFLQVNPAFERQTGLTDAQGKLMRELEPAHEDHWFEIYGRVAKTGQAERFVHQAQALHRWFDVFASRTGAPTEHQVAVVFTDITDRIHSEEALVQVNEQLETRVAERTEQVSNLVLELTMSEQEERRRISNILHDDLQQRLFSVIFQLYTVRDSLETEPDAARTTIAEIEEALQDSVQITRQLSVDLSPPILHNEGLLEALRWLANRMHQQHGLQVDVQADVPLPVPNEDLRVLLFQIVRELLFNVVKHAEVNRAQIALTHLDGRVHIEVSDQGHGFTPDGIEGKGMQNSQGLQRIEQRLNLLGGQMEIESTPGHGTRIILVSPLQGREEDQA